MKGKNFLVKVNVPRGEHAVGDGIVAPVTFGVRRVTEEDAREGAWGELVRGGGGDARVTKAPEHTKLIIRGRSAEKKLVGCVVPARAAWTYVK